jgi:hypothetical protein
MMQTIRTIQNVTGSSVTIPVPPEFQGQQVEIQLKVVSPSQPWGEGLKRCAGALADDAEWDGIMEEIYQSRKIERRPQLEDE